MIGCLPTVKNSQLRSAKNSQFRKRRDGDYIGLTIADLSPGTRAEHPELQRLSSPKGVQSDFDQCYCAGTAVRCGALVSGTIGLVPLQHRYRFNLDQKVCWRTKNKLLAIETNLLPNQASVCRQMSALSVSTFMFRVIVTVLGLELLTACVGNRPRLGGIRRILPESKTPVRAIYCFRGPKLSTFIRRV